ncbi:hypothetical protein [endosymbiont GvMRE of Glomus versiforme]|uniref:hypothetical protein n=1 Tax=endosymbiont GvMRE of Glomus versiforme TaxID=2039283 RepID=UPI000EE18B75|nr:hypothetical protein [endosymbiont GvMRE of Glomus versiforme]RHZ35290.1 hypothetical protein GvMRE_IIg66 [endosymbiont GvMRE of Glomus versiforme]
MDNKEIQLLKLETGILWPYHDKKKALSASTLTKILREIEYKEIPTHILLKAAERGKNFHEIIQGFVENGVYPPFVDSVENVKLNKLDKRIYETINFLKKNKSLKLSRFIGSEKLHYVFYKGKLLATYIDLEFYDFVVELKSNSIKTSKLKFGRDNICLDSFEKLFASPFALLIFEIQLLIQYLCTGKNIYLLWSTGEGIIFNRFKISNYSLKILDMLIDLNDAGDIYSLNVKKNIIQEIINKYLVQYQDYQALL